MSLWLGVAVCGAISSSAPAQDSAQDSVRDSIQVRGELRDDFGRLILDWGQTGAPEITIDLTDERLVLRFDRPVRLDPAAVRANLKAYFRAADLAADGRSLILPLKKPLTYRSSRSAGRFTLDLALPSETKFDNDGNTKPAESIAAAPSAPQGDPPAQPVQQPAAVTASAQPSNGPSLQVRTGEHTGYSRLALDWPTVDFTTRQQGQQVEIIFNKPGKIDPVALAKRLPARARSITARQDGNGNLVLALDLPPNVTAASFRNGATVVLDLRDGAPPPAAMAALAPAATTPATPAPDTAALPPATPAPEVVAAPAVTDAPALATAPPTETSPETTPETVAVPALQSALPVAEAPIADPVAPTQTLAQTPAPVIATPVTVTKEPAVTPATAPPAPVAINASAVASDNGVVLTFAFPKATGLAAFKRGDAFWLVFNQPGPVDIAGLVHAAPVLTGLTRVETPYATALRLPGTARLGGANMGAAISGDGKTWQISLGPKRNLRPAGVVEQRRESLGNGGTSLLLQAANPGAAIELGDPEAGDRLAVVPVRTPGLGLADGADWPDFRLLASYQGVAVVPISERTRVESLPNGVVVTTMGKIEPKIVAETEPPPLENGASAPAVAAATPAAEAESGPGPGSGSGEPEMGPPPLPALPGAKPSVAEQVIPTVKGLFDLPEWRRGGEASFDQDDKALRAAVENAPPSQKPAANLALAEFRFANARYSEAVEALDQLKGTPLENDRLVQSLRGAAAALMGRTEEAKAELSRPDIAAVPEVSLFQAYLAALDRNFETAAKIFSQALPAIDDFPKPARMQLRRAAAEALIEQGDPLTAQVFLDGMRLDSPDAESQAYYDYLNGRQQLRMGNKEMAAEIWHKLAESPVPEVRARAQFDVTELELAEGKIDVRQAATTLESLRFVWRGNDFEFDLLYRLGELYLAADLPRRGLTTLRQAATNFPTRPEAKDATDAMAQAFHDLYLGNQADRLPPLTAVALYDEFRELTPSGVEGDRMITALADRLVKVDLLDSAAQLLENQVTKRLAGMDKARAGTRWAAIALLDRKPDQALKAIKASEIPDMPPDLVMQRRRLQGRALFETGDTLQGLALIRPDNSLDGLWLKADLQWRLREWPMAASALADLIRAEAARVQLDLPTELTAEDIAADPAMALINPVDSQAVNEERDQKFTEVLAPLILNQATALSLANDRGGLRRLGRAYGRQMAKGPYATAFATLTSPSANLADSIGAAMQSVDQLGAFVEDYRTRLRDASLSSPAEPGL